MKTSRLLLLAGLLAGSVSFALAGPGPQFWNRPAAPKATSTVALTSSVPAPAVAAASCVTCACCKKG